MQDNCEHWSSYEGQEYFFENLHPFLIAKLMIKNVTTLSG